jgi:phage repressor protein C with HTH and peptisase S24 domain
VSQGTIGNLESGLRQTARRILDIAVALDVDPMWLANGQGEPAARGITNTPTQEKKEASNEASNVLPFVKTGPAIHVGDEPDTIPIRRVTLQLRAGFTGFETVPELEDGGVLHVPRIVIESQGLVPHQLLAIRVKGASMEPMLFENDFVVIDTSKKEPVNRGVFAVNFNNESCVKQLIDKGGQWLLHSMNPDFHPVNVRSGECGIVGQVVYQPGRVLVGRT